MAENVAATAALAYCRSQWGYLDRDDTVRAALLGDALLTLAVAVIGTERGLSPEQVAALRERLTSNAYLSENVLVRLHGNISLRQRPMPMTLARGLSTDAGHNVSLTAADVALGVADADDQADKVTPSVWRLGTLVEADLWYRFGTFPLKLDSLRELVDVLE